jgi:hypothetical protein
MNIKCDPKNIQNPAWRSLEGFTAHSGSPRQRSDKMTPQTHYQFPYLRWYDNIKSDSNNIENPACRSLEGFTAHSGSPRQRADKITPSTLYQFPDRDTTSNPILQISKTPPAGVWRDSLRTPAVPASGRT